MVEFFLWGKFADLYASTIPSIDGFTTRVKNREKYKSHENDLGNTLTLNLCCEALIQGFSEKTVILFFVPYSKFIALCNRVSYFHA